MRRPAPICLLPVLLGLLPQGAALALDRGELELGAGPALGRALLPTEPDNGPGAMAHASLGFGPQLGLDAALGGTQHAGPTHIGFATLSLRWQVDLSNWEPFLLAGGGVYQGELPAGVPFGRWGLHLGLGLKARGWWTHFAPGVELRYHAFTEKLASYPHYFTLALLLDGILRPWG